MICALAVVASLGGYGVFWLTHDRVFYGFGSALGVPVQTGHTAYIGLAALPVGAGPAGSLVDVRDVKLKVVANTADANIRLLVCVDRGADAAIIGGGVVLDDPSRYCASIVPWRSGRIALGARASGLVVAVTPRHPGTARIDGADVTFRHGLRWGRQHVGLSITTTTLS